MTAKQIRNRIKSQVTESVPTLVVERFAPPRKDGIEEFCVRNAGDSFTVLATRWTTGTIDCRYHRDLSVSLAQVQKAVHAFRQHEADTKADLVAEADACPNCGERHQDNLVWLNDEDEQVQCSKCNMVYRPNATDAGAAGTKLDLREIPSLATHATPIEDGSDIPETLATATIRILKVHHKNGDLAWVEDMIAELEAGNDLSDYIDTDRDCSPAGPM